ncbi:glycosyltransferase family 2 protein [Flavobacterium piscis]|uniref:Glycosyltransferase involved in cell wall biosynthesis n=1 Tax=Flavobacterium piscis TaxID=1114874 RepID=A0ABU1Y3Y7_9FLAO|nr:glycosyltransferase family 2 protein [Flavobacterium piscis]MDR7208943.1 glycosyltransferase involved in cell wall biosynthesis [Flavobacterium piscis]
MKLKEFVTATGEIILYNGQPNFDKLEIVSKGAGDIWHSSFEQGYKNVFQELVYQTAVFFIFINDFDNLDECLSWRINPNQFAVRKSVWETLKGFDTEYKNVQLQALDFGYNALRNSSAIPLYIKGLFEETAKEEIHISVKDRYVFFRKNFKIDHSIFMLYRKGIWKWKEWEAFFYAKKNFRQSGEKPVVKARELKSIEGNPSISYIIPTMMRQDFTLQLIEDLAIQTYPVSQVVIVDATPENLRDEKLYNEKEFPFELIVKWQETKGSCRARNEAIDLCTGDYIVFGDDDVRVQPDFIENHIRILQTYQVNACNGLDIRADNQQQDLTDLEEKLKELGDKRWKVGANSGFSNANSCVKTEYVRKLVGNDINFDGGYGEDSDFGMSLVKLGQIVILNPFSPNLHLKPPVGGYRFWGNQARILGKKRKAQPWELDTPVKFVRPVPSPTVMYGIVKHFTAQQVVEYKYKHFFLYLFKGSKKGLLYRFLRLPYKNRQFKKSLFYAKKLNDLGIRHK